MARLTTPHRWAKDRTPAEWANHHLRVVVLLIFLAVVCSYPAGVFVLALLTARHNSQAVAAAAAAPARIEGSGVVVSIGDGSMTLQHSGVPAIGMAAGVTVFPAPAPIIKRTQVGDQLTFDLAKTPNGGTYAISSVKNAALGQ